MISTGQRRIPRSSPEANARRIGMMKALYPADARIHLKASESRMLGWRRVLTGTAASQTIPSDNTPIGRDLS